FLQTVVRPNMEEFNADHGNVRRAYNAVAVVDALAAHIYMWCKTSVPEPPGGRPAKDGSFNLPPGNGDQCKIHDRPQGPPSPRATYWPMSPRLVAPSGTGGGMSPRLQGSQTLLT